MEKRGWIDDTVRGCGVTILDSGITVISDDLCVDKIRDGGHRCRPVESSRWHWSEGFNRGPRLVRSPRTSWLSNLGHGARYALFSIPTLSIRAGWHPVSSFHSFFSFFLLSIKSARDRWGELGEFWATNLWIFNWTKKRRNKTLKQRGWYKLFQILRRVQSRENWSFPLWMYLNIHKDIPARVLAMISNSSRSCSL